MYCKQQLVEVPFSFAKSSKTSRSKLIGSKIKAAPPAPLLFLIEQTFGYSDAASIL
jgi:hypothetical protein